jgi:hypothetical protein
LPSCSRPWRSTSGWKRPTLCTRYPHYAASSSWRSVILIE